MRFRTASALLAVCAPVAAHANNGLKAMGEAFEDFVLPFIYGFLIVSVAGAVLSVLNLWRKSEGIMILAVVLLLPFAFVSLTLLFFFPLAGFPLVLILAALIYCLWRSTKYQTRRLS